MLILPVLYERCFLYNIREKKSASIVLLKNVEYYERKWMKRKKNSVVNVMKNDEIIYNQKKIHFKEFEHFFLLHQYAAQRNYQDNYF